MISRALALAAVALAGCASPAEELPRDSGAAETSVTADTGATGFFVDRATACAKFVDALETRAAELSCALTTPPSCPATFDALEAKQGLGGKCVRYDDGSISNCVALIATYKSCDDFATKPCSLVVQEDATGASCATSDAGGSPSTDAATDAAGG